MMRKIDICCAVFGIFLLAACGEKNKNDHQTPAGPPFDAVGSAMNPSSPAKADDSAWVVKAYQDGLTEIELSDHFKKQLSHPELVNLAEMMSVNHAKLNDKIKALAASKNINLPQDVDLKGDQLIDEGPKSNGPDLDMAYATRLVNDHQKAVGLYENLSTRAGDPEIRKFFTEKLPEIKHHLYMANSVRDSVSARQLRQK
jgi:putative membrane protein